MSNQDKNSVDQAPSSQPGPDILTERTLTGIFVHLIGLLTSFIGPLLIYSVSDNEFTKQNARNAFNWQLFYLTLFIGIILLFGGILVADFVLPDLIVIALFLILFALFFAVVLIGFLTIVFPLIATGKAIFGSAWVYPIAPDFFDLDRSAFGLDFNWWKPLILYAVTAPILFGFLLWSLLTEVPESEIWAGAFVVTLLCVLVVSLFTLVFLFKDIETVRQTNGEWEPNWLPHLIVPLSGGIMTYLVAAYYLQSENPSGDAIYGYMAVLWVVTVTYLYQRHKHLGTP